MVKRMLNFISKMSAGISHRTRKSKHQTPDLHFRGIVRSSDDFLVGKPVSPFPVEREKRIKDRVRGWVGLGRVAIATLPNTMIGTNRSLFDDQSRMGVECFFPWQHRRYIVSRNFQRPDTRFLLACLVSKGWGEGMQNMGKWVMDANSQAHKIHYSIRDGPFLSVCSDALKL